MPDETDFDLKQHDFLRSEIQIAEGESRANERHAILACSALGVGCEGSANGWDCCWSHFDYGWRPGWPSRVGLMDQYGHEGRLRLPNRSDEGKSLSWWLGALFS
jgi:hypothetical protein